MKYIYQKVDFFSDTLPTCKFCGSDFIIDNDNIIKCKNEDCDTNKVRMSHQKKKKSVLPEDVYKKYIEESSAFHYKYWMKKGFSEDEAKEHVKKNSTKAGIKGNLVLSKEGRRRTKLKDIENLILSGVDKKNAKKIVDEDYKSRNNGFKIKCWTDKGFTVDEAKEKIQHFQEDGRQKGIKSKKENLNYFENTQLGYYINQGMTEENAQLALRERQATFSLKKCRLKYGEIKGLKIWKDRQIKWQNTIQSKPKEELDRINKSKDATSLKAFNKKYGAEGDKKYEEYWSKHWKDSKTYSKEATNFFEKIICKLPYKLDYRYKNKEYFLYGEGKINFYDFTILDLKIIIEYHGIAWHPHYDKLSEDELKDWRNPFGDKWTKSEIRKKKLAKNKGFKLYEIWSDEDLENKINYLIKVIKNEYNRREV